MRQVITATSVAVKRANSTITPRLFNPHVKFLRPPVAGLHNFATPRTEVVIANNSGLFFTLATIKKHGKAKHPDVYLVKPDFWLDWLHSDYYDLDWGQSPRGLPWFVRNEFYKVYPHHPEDKAISWHQFQELRKQILSELYGLGVKIHTGVPTIADKGHYYRFATNEGSFCLSKTDNFHVYNSLRLPKVDHGLEIAGTPISVARSATELYRYDRKFTPSACVLVGNGRSAVWAAQHFPDTAFVVIGLDESLPLIKGEDRPENIQAIFKKSEFLKYFTLRQNKEDRKMLDIVPNNSNTPLYQGMMYCTLGFQFKRDLTSLFNPDVLTIPIGEEKRKWIAVESLPPGGLMEATMAWAASTQNLYWAYEPSSYHPADFMNQVVSCLEKSGLKFSLKFFDHLGQKILSKTKELSDGECVELYKECYIHSHDKTTISTIIINEFEFKLRQIIKESREKYLAQDRISPTA